jgi:hypothetical protein
MTNDYIPDRWIMIRFESEETIVHKILAGWSGSYLEGQSWKLNSGVVKVEDDGQCYLFHGSSGSVYRCHKGAYGMNMIMSDTFNRWIRNKSAGDIPFNMTMLPEDTNFMEINYE